MKKQKGMDAAAVEEEEEEENKALTEELVASLRDTVGFFRRFFSFFRGATFVGSPLLLFSSSSFGCFLLLTFVFPNRICATRRAR